MTDLNRVKGMYGMVPEEQGWRIIDAHLKEDAEKEAELLRLIRSDMLRHQYATELIELREAVRAALEERLRVHPGEWPQWDRLRQLIEEKP